MNEISDKEIYFPREKFFTEVQDLVSSFFSTGNYFTENIEKSESFLTEDDNQNDFYYTLLFFSLISNASLLLQLYEQLLRHLKSQRKKRIVYNEGQIVGDIDIEKYIQKNYLEKNEHRIYPSIIHYSNYQLPEYQLSLAILVFYETKLSFFMSKYKTESSSLFFKTAYSLTRKLSQIRINLQKKYGININENIPSLIKKVEWRYKSKKITNNSFFQIIELYRSITNLKGIDLSSKVILDYIKHDITFDDRLYELWLLKKTVNSLHESIKNSTVTYLPLYEARKRNIAAALIYSEDFTIEVFYQNRKQLLSKEKLKWYWERDGEKERIGAIPDIILRKKYTDKSKKPLIVLLDAKQRKWLLEYDMQRIKGEVVQQIYILDNFKEIFEDNYKSILIAHNDVEYQTRKYYTEENPNYLINVISLNIQEQEIDDSIKRYMQDISLYLKLGN